MVTDALLIARAAWSRLVEPGDAVAGALVAALGPQEALDWLRGHEPLPGLAAADGRARAALGAAAQRWRTRLPDLDAARDLGMLERVGGRLLVPEAPGWPRGLEVLGSSAPMCLWVRGSLAGEALGAALRRSVALVGARACTGYGEHVTAEIAAGVAARGWCVVSGGAYGIDAVAHRAALAGDGTTVAFLAGGVDRLYPAGNTELLRAVADAGALVSEVPPGSVPAKVRFLQRNRLIAAVSGATVVVEAAWRSGALSTARHAASLLRPVGAVPGPVTSASSAGCHRLLRDGVAVCVCDTAEVLELVEPVPAPEPRTDPRAGDGLDLVLRRTLDALPLRRPAPEGSVARTAGLSEREVRASLGRLELAGLAVRDAHGWRRANPDRSR
ncbi:DNA processing protein DprA [Actinotalea fermentans]|uniref:DNA processing protein DprA n=1 Tax=Actinotalea fermentans TaxID=43671 RepID=A0A511YVY7_9CELL|nr:DNA processing protein DprA [Actinotalea fermentans]